MEEGMRLALLGGLQITRGAAPLADFVSVKAPALLCYLAVSGRAHFRPALAGMFWGDFAESGAAANLRKALSNLRQLAGPYLLIDHQTVAFNRALPYWLDVEILQAGCERRAPGEEDLGRLRVALDLYQGDFLEGLYVREAPAFEEWLLWQRERLKQTAIQGLHTLVSHYAAKGDQAEAIEYAGRLLALDPLREDIHQQRMLLMARAGQRNAALVQYETCRRILQQELGVEPMPETTAVYRRIQAMGAARARNMPAPLTPFVGRRPELATIASRLADPDCRLLTIVGPGGTGKTRLAVQAAIQNQPAYLHGTAFGAVEMAETADTLASLLLAALSVPQPHGADTQAQLLSYLQEKEILLLLDGCDRLAARGETALIEKIMSTAPAVKLLATARRRLHLPAEWLLPLAGLDYPRLEARPAGASAETDPDPADFGAVQLFLNSVRRVRPGFCAGPEDRRLAVQVCQAAEGLPLAIELAATWADRRSLADIAAGLAAAPGPFDVPWAGSGPSGLRAVFEGSWALLSETERRLFCRLSIFHGGFSLSAAELVAGASPDDLARLADRSLLRSPAPRRYAMHELLREYGEEKLELSVPEEVRLTRTAHCQYYLGPFLRERSAEMRAGDEPAAVARLKEDADNVRVAWRRAVGGCPGVDITTAATWLSQIAHNLGGFYETDLSWFSLL